MIGSQTIVSICIFLCLCVTQITAVDRSKFRTCQDTGFCKKFRLYQPSEVEKFSIRKDSETHALNNGIYTAHVYGGFEPTRSLSLQIFSLVSGVFRIKLTEHTNRWQPVDLLQATGLQTLPYQLVNKENLPIQWQNIPSDKFLAIQSKEYEENMLIIQYSPLRIELYSQNQLSIVLNDRDLMHFEHSSLSKEEKKAILQEQNQSKDRHQGKTIVDYGEDGLAIYSDGSKEERTQMVEEHLSGHDSQQGESFGGHHDTMPYGSRSVGLDISFPFAEHVYGIPEHSTPLSLPNSINGPYTQPYRLYNLDVFEYELSETMALYGHIPVLYAHGLLPTSKKPLSAGLFWFNPSESFVDISQESVDNTKKASTVSGGKSSILPAYKAAHWISESGDIDVFLFVGQSPKNIFRQFGGLVGTQALPPMFALGYHQCRWNYRDERDVANVNSMFEQLDYPYDVIWLDIEHTNGKRYFTWDKAVFPNPIDMQKNISAVGRKMVTIVDPHIKRDGGFHVHKEATDKGYYIKTKDGADFDGWCWPGSSSYLDFTSPVVRSWWAEQFTFDHYHGSTADLFTWNDMNEPSVFNGPEVSMNKDTKNLAGVEHREWHNLYGIYMQMATAEGQIQRCRADKAACGVTSTSTTSSTASLPRPFVLTRAFWAGSQRFGAMWTGDNKADWSHLQISLPMLLSINIAGLSFAGADVGGFFGDASAELFTRWYEAGAFTPFFRGHAHHDSKRREPWVYGEPHTSIHRNIALLRYSLLPYWYSVFFDAYSLGLPVMRPMFVEFPEDVNTFGMDDQYLIGDSLLIKPVTAPGIRSVQVYLPKLPNTCQNNELLPWYDLETMMAVTPSSSNDGLVTYPAPLEKLPAFVRPGTILPRKLRTRRSSKTMLYDPYTFFVYPGVCDEANGKLYMDDEHTFAHQDIGAFAIRHYSYHRVTSSNQFIYRLESKILQSSIQSYGQIDHVIEASDVFTYPNTIERIVIAGVKQRPSSIRLVDSLIKEFEFVYQSKEQILIIKKPDVRVMDVWAIDLFFEQ